MIIINNWLKQPEDYDAEFWQYNNFNIDAIAFHIHDGTNGDQLPPSSLLQLQDTVTPSTPDGNLFYADKALPVDNDWYNTTISFFLNDERIYLDYERVDDDTFRVYSAFNSIVYEVRYA